MIVPRGRKKALLLPYKDELLSMRNKGFSYQQLADWLAEKEIIVTKNTVRLFLEKLS